MLRKLIPIVALALIAGSAASADAPARRLPEPAVAVLASRDAPAAARLQTAVFAGGCFWGVQGVFSHVKGVVHATSGYAGGAAATAHYEVVSTGLTGHAESVRVTFDPQVVSYGELLRIFFSVALDPTEVNRQGPDDGSQYRSVVFTTDAGQAKAAGAYIAQLNGAHAFSRPIATQVKPLAGFYAAEAYHQDFFARHPYHPYIQAWDAQKVDALKALYPERYVVKAASAA